MQSSRIICRVPQIIREFQSFFKGSTIFISHQDPWHGFTYFLGTTGLPVTGSITTGGFVRSRSLSLLTIGI